ncbi:MAG: protein rep [Dermatophilaceae bacterium]
MSKTSHATRAHFDGAASSAVHGSSSPATTSHGPSRAGDDAGVEHGAPAPRADGVLGPEAWLGPDGEAVGLLDTYANSAPLTLRNARRRSRFKARRALRSITTLDRVRACGMAPHDAAGVALVLSDGEPGVRIAGWRGVVSCGSVWACPRCSAVIAEHRAEELREGLDEWRRQGGAVALLTLTMQHSRDDALDDLWDGAAGSWRRLVGGKPWLNFKEAAGVVGTLRVVEVTHGAAGWHVHLHVLVFLDPSKSVRWQGVGGDAQFEAHFAAMASRGPIVRAWQRVVGRAGYFAAENAQDMRPVSLDEAGSSINRYFVKNGWDAADELARGASKKGRRGNRTPMGILHDIRTGGLLDDVELWNEWEQVSHGRRQMTWSRGVRALLGLVVVSDNEVAAETADGAEADEQLAARSRGDDVLLILTAEQWRHVSRTSKHWLLLEAAERDPGQVCRWRLAASTTCVALPSDQAPI